MQRFTGWLVRRAMGTQAIEIISSSLPTWEASYKRWTQPGNYGELIGRNLSIVYACASRNAAEVAQAPLRLYATKASNDSKTRFRTKAVSEKQRGWLLNNSILQKYTSQTTDIEEIVEHPFLDLMQTINPWNNGFETLELIETYLELTGNAYLFKVRNGLNAPSELWVLPSQWVFIEPDPQEFIKCYRFGAQEPRRNLEPKDVIHFKFPNPRDMWYGMGPLQAALCATDLHTQMGEFETALLRNNARPDIAITADQPMGEDQVKASRLRWNKEFGGHKKAGKVVFLTGGLDIKQLGWSPRELSFLSGRKVMIEEIAMIFGVPLSKLKTEDVNRANAEAGDYTYAKNTTLPRLRRVEQKLNEDLLPEFDERLFCAFDNPVPEDKEFRLREIQGNLLTGYTAINEERQRDNKEEVPWGSVPILPFNMAPLGTPQLQPAQPLPGKVQPEEELPAKHLKGIDEAPQDFHRALQQFFDKQRHEAIKNIEHQAQIDADRATKELQELAYPYLKEQIERGGERGINRVRERGKSLRKQPFDIAWDITNPKVQEFLQQYLFRFSFAVNRKTNQLLADTIKEGIANGETIASLASRVDEVFNFAEKYRAERIARTESARAYSAGNEAGYVQSGLVSGKEWVVSPGACEFCLEMQGKVVDLGSNFLNLGERQQGTEGGDSEIEYSDIEFPPRHPSCVCDLAPVLIEVQ